jgi:hypothetical protein
VFTVQLLAAGRVPPSVDDEMKIVNWNLERNASYFLSEADGIKQV